MVDATMRRALLRRFPYAVFYEVGAVEIVVYAVFHWREILAPGCADGTDNFAVERTRFARR